MLLYSASAIACAAISSLFPFYSALLCSTTLCPSSVLLYPLFILLYSALQYSAFLRTAILPLYAALTILGPSSVLLHPPFSCSMLLYSALLCAVLLCAAISPLFILFFSALLFCILRQCCSSPSLSSSMLYSAQPYSVLPLCCSIHFFKSRSFLLYLVCSPVCSPYTVLFCSVLPSSAPPLCHYILSLYFSILPYHTLPPPVLPYALFIMLYSALSYSVPPAVLLYSLRMLLY